MKKKYISKILMVLAFAFSFCSCSNNDHEDMENEFDYEEDRKECIHKDMDGQSPHFYCDIEIEYPNGMISRFQVYQAWRFGFMPITIFKDTDRVIIRNVGCEEFELLSYFNWKDQSKYVDLFDLPYGENIELQDGKFTFTRIDHDNIEVVINNREEYSQDDYDYIDHTICVKQTAREYQYCVACKTPWRPWNKPIYAYYAFEFCDLTIDEYLQLAPDKNIFNCYVYNDLYDD